MKQFTLQVSRNIGRTQGTRIQQNFKESKKLITTLIKRIEQLNILWE